MNGKSGSITGLILCAIILHTQGAGNPAADGRAQRSAGSAYGDILWTNNLFISPWSSPDFSAGASSRADLDRSGESDLSQRNSVYQVTVPLPDRDASSDLAGRSVYMPAIDTKADYVQIFAAGDELYWKYRAPRADESPTDQGTVKKKKDQIIVIEPLNGVRTVSFDRIKRLENMPGISRPEPVWYEWLNPRLFLPRYAELWTKGSEAQPIALMLFKF